MNIKQDTDFLLLKIKTPDLIDFYTEHSDIISNNGFVWVCKFGKTNLIPYKIITANNCIFLKDTIKNNNNVYLIHYNELSSDIPNSNYPKYYDTIELKKSLWFKVKKIQKIDYNFLIKNFKTKSSNSSLENVFKSMCNSFYITAVHNCTIKEED